MAIAVKIQNSDYIPAGEAGRMFGYTADYVTRLAREGKVAAQQLGKQWLVNADSLATFVASSSKNKELRSDRIRRERQLERAQFQKKVVRAKAIPSPYAPVIFSDSWELKVQALLTSVCALFVGGVLGMFLYTTPVDRAVEIVAELESIDAALVLESGKITVENVASVSAAVDATFMYAHDMLRSLAISVYTFAHASSRKSVSLSYEDTQGLGAPSDAMLVTEGVVVLPGDASRAEIDAVRTSFSDEVVVTPEGDGETGMVQPVFRARAGDQYRYVLVPVDPGR